MNRKTLTRLRSIDKANKQTSYINGPWTDVYLKDRRPVVFTHDPGMLFDPKELCIADFISSALYTEIH